MRCRGSTKSLSLAVCPALACLLACAPGPPLVSRNGGAGSAIATTPSALPQPAELPRRAVRAGSVEAYALDLALDVPARAATAVAELTLAATVTSLDLEAKALDVTGVSLRDAGGALQPIPFTSGQGRLHVDVPPSAQGTTGSATQRVLQVRYGIRASSGLVITDHEAYTAFDTRAWLPCDFDPGHKATFSLALTVPSGWTVVGSGRASATSTRHELRLEAPHAAYLFGFAAGAYGAFEDGEERAPRARFYGPAALVETHPELPKRLLDEVHAAATLFADRSGRAYPGAEYAMVATRENGGQELAFMSLGDVAGLEAFDEEPSEDWLVVHELAHMWWGNAITCDRWADFWLNEAFAVFMTAAIKESRWSRAGYDGEVAGAWRKFDRIIAKGKDRPLVGSADTTADHAGGGIVYTKGALVLFELRALLGDDAFWRGVKLYSEAAEVVRTEDLRAAMERASAQDLGEFFRAWTEGLGAPTARTRPPG